MAVIVSLMTVCAALASAVARPRAVERPRNAADDGAPVMVMVELFTSEGCSSCPPADDVLTRFISSQPVPGVIVVGLGEHVDYWDRLG